MGGAWNAGMLRNQGRTPEAKQIEAIKMAHIAAIFLMSDRIISIYSLASVLQASVRFSFRTQPKPRGIWSNLGAWHFTYKEDHLVLPLYLHLPLHTNVVLRDTHKWQKQSFLTCSWDFHVLYGERIQNTKHHSSGCRRDHEQYEHHIQLSVHLWSIILALGSGSVGKSTVGLDWICV